jgi:hypothetical protein
MVTLATKAHRNRGRRRRTRAVNASDLCSRFKGGKIDT